MKGKKAKMRAAMFAITAVVCVLFFAVLMQGQALKAKISENEKTEQELTAQIEEEKARTEEIEKLKDYYNSEEYIRKAAQERFGLVEDGQIVFRREE